MPTGYTAGILDGEITTFQQFAKICSRAFGATVHMRDEPLGSGEYEKRKPSDYHLKKIEEANKLLNDSKTLSDDVVMAIKRAELLRAKEYHLEAIEKAKIGADKLNAILKQAKEYTAPTPEHEGIRKFMIEQLIETLKFDCDRSDGYHDAKLKEIALDSRKMNPESVRISMREQAYKDLSYHQREYDLELKRCNESNQWMETFIKSLS